MKLPAKAYLWVNLREATLADLNFLVKVDLEDEGVTSTYNKQWGDKELAEHRAQMAGFITDEDKAAWVYEESKTHKLIGTIMYLFRNVSADSFYAGSAIPQISRELFPPDGQFCEIFQLWIDPVYRRRGLASKLKRHAEVDSLRRGVHMMYTHTEESNSHVIELNEKIGYREVRRGPIWDDIIRVSLIKRLDTNIES